MTAVAEGMTLLLKEERTNLPGRPTRYELWTVKSVRKTKNGATATLIRGSESCSMTASARFPGGEVREPFRVFALSQNDLKILWDGLAARSGEEESRG